MNTENAPLAAGTPGESRRIFRYWNGERAVAADPMVLWRSLVNDTAEDFHELYDVGTRRVDPDDHAGQREALAAHRRLVERVRQVFRLPELDDDGKGVTESEAVGILQAFFVWNAEKKDSGGPSPNGSPPSDGPPPASDSTDPTAAP